MARVLPSSSNIESLHALVFAITYEEEFDAERRHGVELGAFFAVSALFPATLRPVDFPPNQITFSCEPPHCPHPAIFVTIAVVLPLGYSESAVFGPFPFRE